jgi:hypothetical protein
VTTITSPNGRSATLTSYHSSSYARAETYLPVDFSDVGTYNVQSSHWLCCPYMGANPYTGAGCYPSASSSSSGGVSLPKSGWVVVAESPTTCYFQATCSGRCCTSGEQWSAPKVPTGGSCSSSGIYLQAVELYAFGQCYHSTRSGTYRMFPGECD